MKKNSLNKEIWKYFLIFSIIILGFLWIFQVLFLKQYYRLAKTKDIKEVAKIIKTQESSPELNTIINDIAYKNEVCVEITDDKFLSIFNSYTYGKGCFNSNNISMNYKYDFIKSNNDYKTYELVNPTYNNKTLVYALKLSNHQYAYINTSLDPIDSTVSIIIEQLLIVTFVVLILSFIVAYFISKFISAPIVKIKNAAIELSKGNFGFKVNNDSKVEEIYELEKAFNYTSEELSKTDTFRRDLMANISHDLKTPLTMIKAYAEMSVDLHVDDKDKRTEDVNIICDEVDRLSLLVNDILTLSKMQSDIDKLVYENFDLVELIFNILKRYSVLKEVENYHFEFKHNVKDCIISADKKKIEQVIYNLINNAINYTGNDNIVTIKLNKNKKEILVEIIDTGKGIKKEEIPYIWDKYYKNKKQHKRNLVGTGLGLSIVKSILEAHDYEYGVKSEQKKGSCFYFRIKE